MSPAAVAFVPAAPLLVPQVAAGSAGLDAELRATTAAAINRAIAATPTEVVVVASTAAGGTWAEDATWSFAGFGVNRAPSDPRPALPWSLGIGAWLLDECGWSGSRRYVGLGPEPAAWPDPAVSDGAAVVVVGDGSARRSERAPGHFDERAAGFDATVAALLAAGDSRGLGAIDESLAGELLCHGAGAWRWLAAVVGGQPVADAELLADVAPYGVCYFVAVWRLGRAQ